MKCSKTRRLMCRYLDSELSEADAREVARHVETCEACAAESRELASVHGLLNEWGGVEPTRGFDWLASRIEEPEQRHVRSWLPVPAWAAAAAAVLGITLGSVVGLQTAEHKTVEPPSQYRVAEAMGLHTFAVNDVLEASLAEGITADVQSRGEAGSQ